MRNPTSELARIRVGPAPISSPACLGKVWFVHCPLVARERQLVGIIVHRRRPANTGMTVVSEWCFKHHSDTTVIPVFAHPNDVRYMMYRTSLGCHYHMRSRKDCESGNHNGQKSTQPFAQVVHSDVRF